MVTGCFRLVFRVIKNCAKDFERIFTTFNFVLVAQGTMPHTRTTPPKPPVMIRDPSGVHASASMVSA